jgi:hypothetical protein
MKGWCYLMSQAVVEWHGLIRKGGLVLLAIPGRAGSAINGLALPRGTASPLPWEDGSTWRDCLFSTLGGCLYLEGLSLLCLGGMALPGGTASSLP